MELHHPARLIPELILARALSLHKLHAPILLSESDSPPQSNYLETEHDAVNSIRNDSPPKNCFIRRFTLLIPTPI